MPDNPLVIRVERAAMLLDMQETQIRSLLYAGILRGKKIGQEWRVNLDSVYEAAGLKEPSQPPLQGDETKEAK